MKTETLAQTNKLPANAIVIELLDSTHSHLATICTGVDSNVITELSNGDWGENLFQFEQEVIGEFLKNNLEIKNLFVWTGRVLATGKAGDVLYTCRPL